MVIIITILINGAEKLEIFRFFRRTPLKNREKNIPNKQHKFIFIFIVIHYVGIPPVDKTRVVTNVKHPTQKHS